MIWNKAFTPILLLVKDSRCYKIQIIHDSHLFILFRGAFSLRGQFSCEKLHKETITKEAFSAGLTESMTQRAAYY